MDILTAAVKIVEYLLIFIGTMAVLLVVLLVVISRLSADNPLKRILVMLCYRVAATLAAGVVAVPLEPIPGVDAAFDIGASVLLVLYWLSFFISVARKPPTRSAR
jgi:hypothetical protein